MEIDAFRQHPKAVANANLHEIPNSIIGNATGYAIVYKANYPVTPENPIVIAKKLKERPSNLQEYYKYVIYMSHMRGKFIIPYRLFTKDEPYQIAYDPSFYRYNLSDCIHELRNLDSTFKTLVSMDLSFAMIEYHDVDLVHYDLHPRNVVFDAKKEMYVVDCGLNQIIDPSMKLCPPEYKSPELWIGRNVTKKTDVYSYGIILLELLTEKYPWAGLNEKQIKERVLNGEKPMSIPDGTLPSLVKLINQCLDLNPDHRPTFQDIFDLFASGKILFSDRVQKSTVKARAETLLIYLKNKLRRYFNCMLKSGNLTTGLQSILNELTPKNSYDFFKTLALRFDKETPDDDYHLYLTAVKKAIENKNICKQFVRSELYLRLPFDHEKQINLILGILHWVVINTPNSEINLTSMLLFLLPKRPRRVMHIVATYAKKFAEIENPWTLLDAFLKHYKHFIRLEYLSRQFIMIFYCLCRVYPSYRDARLKTCLDIFAEFLKSPIEAAVKTAYIVLSYPWPIHPEIDQGILINHLENKNLMDLVLHYSIVSEMIYDADYVLAVYKAARHSEKANYVLCLAAEQGLVNYDPFVTDLPTIEASIRLLLTLMIQKVPIDTTVYYLLSRAALLPKMISQSVIIAACLHPKEEDLSEIENSKFPHNLIQNSNNDQDINSILNLFKMYSLLGWMDSYLEFIELLIDELDNPRSLHQAIELLTIISHYQRGALEISSREITSKLEELEGDVQAKEFLPILMQNLEASRRDQY